MPRRNFVLILAAAFVSMACYRASDRNPYGRYFADVMNKVDQLYVEPVDNETLFDSAVKGMLQNLDKHSTFFGPREASQFLSIIDQHYGGIGIEVMAEPKTDQLKVLGTIVGSPAYEADILAGDRILKIDGRATEGMPLDDATDLIRGEIGTPVVLEFGRAGRETPLVMSLKRAEIKVDSVLGDTRKADDSWDFHLHGHPEIGYIRIRTFGERTLDELLPAVTALAKEHIKGLVIDLRFDPGGRLDTAVDVCSLFLPEGKTVVTTKGRDGRVFEEDKSRGSAPMPDTPIVILVNSLSASASEIVAACLQDYHRAVVCGQRTYGKGTVQRVLRVEGNKSVLKLTTAYYWRPSNKNIHRRKDAKDTDEWGVMPDAGFAIEMDEKQIEAMRKERSNRDVVHRAQPPVAPGQAAPPPDDVMQVDPQLKRAVEYLEEKPAIGLPKGT
jgi:carboxyl-terminal processing protease